jgi:two-component system cell cycle response regulator
VSEQPPSKTVVTVISRIQDRPADRTSEAAVVVIYGAELGKKFNLQADETVVGRSAKADIQVDQESVSRHHAKIVNTGTSFILRDLESTNGTYVNDEFVDEYVLRDGDLVKIGRTIFKFLSGSNIENAYHEEIYRLTTVDGLTQVYNKRYFLETLEREMSRAQRYRRELGLIMFDIDHFKKVNDTHGHLAGDHVLKHLASTLRPRIRREDMLARYGGEEFAIVLPEIDAANAVQFAEKVRVLIERTTFRYENVSIPVTISVGVAALASGARTPGELIEQADERLYRAKSAGRNKVVGT